MNIKLTKLRKNPNYQNKKKKFIVLRFFNIIVLFFRYFPHLCETENKLFELFFLITLFTNN